MVALWRKWSSQRLRKLKRCWLILVKAHPQKSRKFPSKRKRSCLDQIQQRSNLIPSICRSAKARTPASAECARKNKEKWLPKKCLSQSHNRCRHLKSRSLHRLPPLKLRTKNSLNPRQPPMTWRNLTLILTVTRALRSQPKNNSSTGLLQASIPTA